uniref:beta-galactosidase n=1 Tax=Ananas comosus var. bracteatus TaxID=296719 RepID=A0A6V7PIX5_ANACO|nr:unnamed protein product [Ananas comosus var. bracteatus]
MAPLLLGSRSSAPSPSIDGVSPTPLLPLFAISSPHTPSSAHSPKRGFHIGFSPYLALSPTRDERACGRTSSGRRSKGLNQGKYDLVKFIKLIQQQGMYATLRIGSFIQAEWNHGGLPYWLREVEGIAFRTDNEPFKYHMKRFVEKVVQLMKDEKLYASQGGPIILSQIENEYNNIAPWLG